MRQLFLFLQQAAALTREPCSFFDKSTVACVDCKPFALFLGVIAVTILYLTVVLNFAIDGVWINSLDDFGERFSETISVSSVDGKGHLSEIIGHSTSLCNQCCDSSHSTVSDACMQ